MLCTYYTYKYKLCDGLCAKVNAQFSRLYRLSEKNAYTNVCHPILLIYFFILYTMLMYSSVFLTRTQK